MVWMRYYFEHEGPDQTRFDFDRFHRGYGLTEFPDRTRFYWPFTWIDKLRWIEPAGNRAQSYLKRLGEFA